MYSLLYGFCSEVSLDLTTVVAFYPPTLHVQVTVLIIFSQVHAPTCTTEYIVSVKWENLSGGGNLAVW